MSTKTLDFKSLTTKLITEIFNFQFLIFNFTEPPGNACTKSVDCCPLSVDKYYKKTFTSCPKSESGSFFYYLLNKRKINQILTTTINTDQRLHPGA